MQNVQLYERLQELCIQKGVSANKMLTECKINSSFMQDLKSKNVSPSIEKILKLAEYFEVSPNDILLVAYSNERANKVSTENQRLLEHYYKADPSIRKAVDKLLDLEH